MPGFYLYNSNKLEKLIQLLAEIITADPLPPLEPEVVVVQSKGMEKWIRMQLARLTRVSANLEFPFPNALLSQIFEAVVGRAEESTLTDVSKLTWKIMSLLGESIEEPEFQDIKRYLSPPENQLKYYQLARNIADCFDQYQVFRPELIIGWEEGRPGDWQSILWQKLVKGSRGLHRARLKGMVLEKIKDGAVSPELLPARISLFGISTLPPFHMEIFAALSRFMDVHLFLLNPCKEYWADIVSDRYMTSISRSTVEAVTDLELLHLEQGNSLLASMGSLGRDFQAMVVDLDPIPIDHFEDTVARNLLSQIQKDILHLQETAKTNGQQALVSSHDRSIQVHSCHSPMREMEVLYNQLLFMFERDPKLLPKDIVVMAPDIETYVPYIEAVFGVSHKNRPKIPFSIADKTFKLDGQIAPTLLHILLLNEKRFKATEVVGLLEVEAIQNRFEIREGDLPLLRTWIAETGIRWGIDGEHKESIGLAGFKENTWREGLDRLLMGYALPGEGTNLFAGILPYDHVEGSMAGLLGKLAAFVDSLIRYVRSFANEKTLHEWSDLLLSMMDELFLPDQRYDQEAIWIRGIFSGLKRLEYETGFKKKIRVEVIREYLKDNLKEYGYGTGFLTGGVTFCSMLPMRSIPFKIVCLVGMNFDAFPRQSRHVGFDLIAQNPKRGDRSKRNDDRYLFLESLLSAREVFYISYVGQSLEDNSVIPPSALVSELLDYIQENFRGEKQEIIEQITTRHRIHSFSPAYFRQDPKLFSYSEEDFLALRSANDKSQARISIIEKPLVPPKPPLKDVDMDTFISFFQNPAKFFLLKRLNIILPKQEARIEDIEPWEIQGLEAYQLDQLLVRERLAGTDIQKLYQRIRARSILPHGELGNIMFRNQCNEVELFVADLQRHFVGRQREPIEFAIDVSGLRITGKIEGPYDSGLVIWRYATIKPRDLILAWITHLIFCLKSPYDCPLETRLLGKSQLYKFKEIQGPEKFLSQLADILLKGLQRPIHFFPESALEFVKAMSKPPHDVKAALDKALSKWKASDYVRGECEDEYFGTCFGNLNPIDEEFQELATVIFEPIIKNLQ